VTDWFVKLRSLCLAGDFFLCPFVRQGFSKFFFFFLCPSVCLSGFVFVCGAEAKTHRRLPESVWTSTLASERSDFRVLISLCLDSRWFPCNLNVLVITIAEGRNITLEKCLSSLHRCSSSGEGRASSEERTRIDSEKSGPRWRSNAMCARAVRRQLFVVRTKLRYALIVTQECMPPTSLLTSTSGFHSWLLPMLLAVTSARFASHVLQSVHVCFHVLGAGMRWCL
jgi:hypothetical protein